MSLTTELASFVLRLQLRNSPFRDAKGDVEMTPEAIETMVEDVANFLVTCSEDLMATLSLQCRTLSLPTKLKAKRHKERVKFETVTLKLLTSLCDNSERLPEELLGEMTFFILHCYGQAEESQSNLPARKETALVLTAVLPKSQVPAFASQPPEEKKRQLQELRRIVWGIRLHNVACGKSVGTGITPPRDKAELLMSSLREHIEKELEEAISACARYVAVLRSPSTPVEGSMREAICAEYHRQLQLLLNIRMAKQQLDTLNNQIFGELLPSYEAALEAVKDVLGTRSMRSDGVSLRKNVSKATVYPKFIELAEVYEEAQRSFQSFEDIKALMTLSLSLGKVSNSSLPPTLLQEAINLEKEDGPADRCSTEARFESIVTASLPTKLDRVFYARDAETLRARSAVCALNGMCPVTLLEDGLCVEGRVGSRDPAFPGFVMRSEVDNERVEWYAFQTASKLLRFAASSQRFVDHAKTLVKSNMVMVGLFGLVDLLPRELYIEGTRRYEHQQEEALAARQTVSTQTGQIDSYIDRNYRWNEWDLRRQALKLVNLLDMRTHSTQTIASHFRRDNATQCRPPRDDSTQTMQDIAVQPPRTVQYLKGLRGTKTSAIETVQKTFLY